MKKLFLALVLVAFMASLSLAAPVVGMEFLHIVSGIDPTMGLSADEGSALGSPLIMPMNKIGIAWDVTPMVTLIGGITQYNVTTGDITMFNSASGNNSSGLGLLLGAKARLASGKLVPVIGGNISMFSISADDSYVAEGINATQLAITFGCEYVITPGLLLIADGTMLDIISGEIQYAGGGSAKLDNVTRFLPGGSIGLRWYVM